MKKNLVLMISIIFAITSFAQKSVNDLIKDCVFYVVENERMESIEYIDSNGDNVTCSLDDIASLLRKDVITFFELQDKYNTELKIKTFKQTEEYNEYYKELISDYNIITQGKGYLMYNLRYNNSYNTAKRCFQFKIGFDDLYKYSQPNYICFEQGISLSYPTAYLTRTTQRTSLASNGIYNYNILKTTTIPEATALKIENEMENPYCNARLLIIFKLNKAASEKKVVAGYYVYQNFVIGKSINAYLVNVKTGEVYADMSSIFTQTSSNKKSTAKNP